MSSSRAALDLAAGILAATPVAVAGGCARWSEVRGSHFVAVSETGANAASSVARQFEHIRAAVQLFWPWARVTPPAPIITFAAREEATPEALISQFWGKKGQARPGGALVKGFGNYNAVVHLDVTEPNLEQGNRYQLVYHDYFSSVNNFARGRVSGRPLTSVNLSDEGFPLFAEDRLARIRASLEKEGLEFVVGDEAAAKLAREGARGLYEPRAIGQPGSVVLQPSRRGWRWSRS